MIIISRPFFLAFLILAFLLAGFLGGPGNSFEPALMSWLVEVRHDWPQLNQAAALLTQVGSAPITLSVSGVAVLSLLFKRMPRTAALLTVTVLGERLLVDGLKEWVERPRPPLDPAMIHSFAYPSGHSANSMTAFLATALIASPPALRPVAAWAAIILAVMIGLTRVWLGVHWPSDVIGGWALGLLAVAAALAVCQRLGELGFEAQHDVIGRHRSTLD